MSPSDISERLLTLSGVGKNYHGVSVLRDVAMDVRAGEVLGLIGANGAGKSTLLKILSGLIDRDGGTLTWGGKNLRHGEMAERIAIVAQDSQLCEYMTVSENILLGNYPKHWGIRLDKRSMINRSVELLKTLHIDTDPASPVSELPLTKRRMVEISKAVARNPGVLILDEPTATLGPAESADVLNLIRRVSTAGGAVIFVSHRLDEVAKVSDRVTVLKDGEVVGTLEGARISETAMVKLMSDRELRPNRRENRHSGEVCLSGVELNNDKLRDVSFVARSGEVSVLTGLAGSGRSSVLRAIFGLSRSDGQVHHQGRQIHKFSPRKRRQIGVGFVPESRRDGLFDNLSVLDNLASAYMASGKYRGIILRRRKLERLAKTLIDDFGIVLDNPNQAVSELSGGNQQKVMLAASMALKPSVMLVDEPTQGVDVSAKADIHELLRRYCGDGGAVVAVMSETHECLSLGDQFVVLRAGEVTGRLDYGDASNATLTRLAFASGGGGAILAMVEDVEDNE